jgi:hypothetical protein
VAACTGNSFLFIFGKGDKGALYHDAKRTVIVSAFPVMPGEVKHHPDMLFSDGFRRGGANMTAAQAQQMRDIIANNGDDLLKTARSVAEWSQHRGAGKVPEIVTALCGAFKDTPATPDSPSQAGLWTKGLEYIDGPRDLADAALQPHSVETYAARLQRAPEAVRRAISTLCHMSDTDAAREIQRLCAVDLPSAEAATAATGVAAPVAGAPPTPDVVTGQPAPDVTAAAKHAAGALAAFQTAGGVATEDWARNRAMNDSKLFQTLAGSAPFWDRIPTQTWEAAGAVKKQLKVCEAKPAAGRHYLTLAVRKGTQPNGQPAVFKVRVKDIPMNRDNNYQLLRQEFWTRICRQMAKPVHDRHLVFQHEDVIAHISTILACEPRQAGP